ncbi:MAG: hypothetical protein A2Y10_05920 [Planctomycetes bacterium GWF2_41_51]|nr:MAG: hypothetical protein A2Y10_05920 [Planctomycetes bacterium GWF2_41_51]
MLKILNSLKKIDNAIQRFIGACTTCPYLPESIKIGTPQKRFEYCLPDLTNHVCDTLCIHDISGSMSWTDCQPSRLGASVKAAEAFAYKRYSCSPDDRIGLISFNDTAEIVLELTPIKQIELVKKHLKQLKATGGTDIAEGLKDAEKIFAGSYCGEIQRLKRILLLTDGHGGNPVTIAKRLKNQTVLIEVIGIGGDPSAVNEELLRKVATTDLNGFTHYWFFRDTQSLVSHYEKLATGIVFKGNSND